MTKPRGVIFDFDGVVVDSLSAHIAAWKAAYLKLYGLELLETSGLPGRSTGAIAKILAALAQKPTTADELAEEKRFQLKSARHSIQALPGALEAFVHLEAQGIPFGIASNAPRLFIEQTLERLNTKVEHVLGVDDVKRPKPAPDIFLLCARHAGIKFTDHACTIVLEDSFHGLKAAQVAGMFAVGVMTQHPALDLTKAGARRTCLHIADAMEQKLFSDLGEV